MCAVRQGSFTSEWLWADKSPKYWGKAFIAAIISPFCPDKQTGALCAQPAMDPVADAASRAVAGAEDGPLLSAGSMGHALYLLFARQVRAAGQRWIAGAFIPQPLADKISFTKLERGGLPWLVAISSAPVRPRWIVRLP